MLPTIIGVFTFVLILICVLLVLVILMQRPSADAGMGASLGGGAAESAFGGETGNVLTSVCVKCIVVFFVLTFLLFMGNIYVAKSSESSASASEVPSLTSVIEEVSTQTGANAANSQEGANNTAAQGAQAAANAGAEKPEAKPTAESKPEAETKPAGGDAKAPETPAAPASK